MTAPARIDTAPFDLAAGDYTLNAVGQRAARMLDKHTDARVIVRPLDPSGIYSDDAWMRTTDERTGLAVDIRRADCGAGCRCAAEVKVAR